MGLLIPEVYTVLLTDILSALFLLILLPSSLSIAKRWNFSEGSETQYSLEKKRLLISTVVRFLFVLKIPMFLFFIYTNDKLSNVLTGAMCAAGSINATIYGSPLLVFKIVNILSMSAWIVFSRNNNETETLAHTRKEYTLLIILIFLITCETILSIANFSGIDPSAVVSCCSSIYSSNGESSAIYSLKPFSTFYIFLASSALLLIAYLLRTRALVAILSIVFFLSGVLCLILFTSTYIYQLPSHKCPYCILQKEYGYIGYLFYISLFGAVTGGIAYAIDGFMAAKKIQLFFFTGLTFSIIYILLNIFFPLRYYLINGVWL